MYALHARTEQAVGAYAATIMPLPACPVLSYCMECTHTSVPCYQAMLARGSVRFAAFYGITGSTCAHSMF